MSPSPNYPTVNETVHSYTLATLDDAKAYLQRITSEQEQMVIRLLNSVTDCIEQRCGRKLVSRVYDGGAAPNEAPFYLDGFGDPNANSSYTGGWSSSSSQILVPEYPITAVTEAAYKIGDLAGTWRVMNIAQWYEIPNGILVVPFDGFPVGRQNIRLKCTAGFLSTVHQRQLGVLRQAALRWLQILWIDWTQGVGRGTGFSVGGHSVSLIPDEIPKDIAGMLTPFERFC